MLTASVVIFCRIAIATVFALSAVGKVLDVRAFVESVSSFGLLPSSWSRPAAWGFLSAEFAVVFMMGLGGSMLSIGFWLACGLLVAFSIALVGTLQKNERTTCNCFGFTEQQISAYDIVRNVLLVLCSLTGIWALIGPYPTLSTNNTLIIGLMAICFAVIVINLKDVLETLRRPFDTGD